MNRLPLALGLVFAAAAPLAADPADQPLHLVISHGMIAEPGEQAVPATLRNAVQLVHALYPQSEFALTDLDNVPLADLTLDWPKRSNSPLPLLNALGVASNYAFRVDEHYGPAIYFLSPARDLGPRYNLQVFNLKNYLQPGAAELTAQLRSLKAGRKALSARYASDHPKMQEIETQIQEVEQQLNPGSNEDVARRVKQITDLIAETLEEVTPGSPAPKFYFHRDLSLLVVIGDGQAAVTAQKVIAALL